MLDYNECEICKDVLNDNICDYHSFTNGDELLICNKCIKTMINDGLLIIRHDKDDFLEFTVIGLNFRIKQLDEEIKVLTGCKEEYIKELKNKVDKVINYEW